MRSRLPLPWPGLTAVSLALGIGLIVAGLEGGRSSDSPRSEPAPAASPGAAAPPAPPASSFASRATGSPPTGANVPLKEHSPLARSQPRRIVGPSPPPRPVPAEAAPTPGGGDSGAEEAAADENQKPVLSGGGLLEATAGGTVALVAEGTDPDGDRIDYDWEFSPCLRSEDVGLDRAAVTLRHGCSGGEARLAWIDERGAAADVRWLILR